ncbi:MAG: hypothetical protein LBV62_03715 [Rickettsiales bacterium]|nr:hypothetical protein [Rickettsiales bacterium]
MHKDDLIVEIESRYAYVKYSQDSTIEVAKVINNPKVKDLKLNLRCHIFHIGESIVRVESDGEERNYTDISGSIEMSFTTEVGKISIYLRPNPNT